MINAIRHLWNWQKCRELSAKAMRVVSMDRALADEYPNDHLLERLHMFWAEMDGQHDAEQIARERIADAYMRDCHNSELTRGEAASRSKR